MWWSFVMKGISNTQSSNEQTWAVSQFDNLYCKFVDSPVLPEHKELCVFL